MADPGNVPLCAFPESRRCVFGRFLLSTRLPSAGGTRWIPTAFKRQHSWRGESRESDAQIRPTAQPIVRTGRPFNVPDRQTKTSIPSLMGMFSARSRSIPGMISISFGVGRARWIMLRLDTLLPLQVFTLTTLVLRPSTQHGKYTGYHEEPKWVRVYDRIKACPVVLSSAATHPLARGIHPVPRRQSDNGARERFRSDWRRRDRRCCCRRRNSWAEAGRYRSEG